MRSLFLMLLPSIKSFLLPPSPLMLSPLLRQTGSIRSAPSVVGRSLATLQASVEEVVKPEIVLPTNEQDENLLKIR